MISPSSLSASYRQDFPILGRPIHGHPLAYLDNAATTQKPVAVLDALDSFYTQHNANIDRGIHLLSEEATLLYAQARQTVAAFINAPQPSSIVFTRNTTESLNLVATSWGQAHVTAQDRIVITQMEHHANLLPWQRLAHHTGAELVYIPVDLTTGHLVPDWSSYITANTKIVAFPYISNVLGTINPADQLIQAAHNQGAIAVVDAAQAAPFMAIDIQALNPDFLAFSSHKLYGPTGIGVLYGRFNLLQAMDPYQVGGDMIETVTWDTATWRPAPAKFEAGTPAIAQAVGLAAAIDYIQAIGLNHITTHARRLTQAALDQLQAIPQLTIYGPSVASNRGPVIAFSIKDLHPHDLADILDSQGVAIRSGHHCAQPLTSLLNVPATARASFALYNNQTDIDQLCAALSYAQTKLGA